eukprot:617552-Amphidinium_carterae.1
MFTSICEHDKWHGDREDAVVVIQIVLTGAAATACSAQVRVCILISIRFKEELKPHHMPPNAEKEAKQL